MRREFYATGACSVRLSERTLAPEALRLRNSISGRDVLRMPLGPVAELRWGAPYLVAHRADLIAALFEQAALEPLIEVETGVEVVGFARSERGVEAAVRRGEEPGRSKGIC